MKKLLINSAAVLAVLAILVSCNNELNTLGGNILGEDELSGRIQRAEFDVIGYNALLNPVQTNNFNSVLLGSYFDPTFGNSTYDFVSQIALGRTNPQFGNNATVKKVTLDIPFFSSTTGINGEAREYDLDSVYGFQEIDVQIWENGFLLSDFDLNDPTQAAVYYSDMKPTIEANKLTLLGEITDFFPSSDEVVVSSINDEGEVVIESRDSPRIRIELDTNYFQNKIVDQQGSLVLQNNSEFQNYFRGLYFKVSGIVGNGNLVGLDIDNATLDVLIDSEFDVDSDPTTPDEVVESNVPITFQGRRVNLINNQFTPSVISAIQSSSDPLVGAENLYLKGGSGSIAVLELFGEDVDMDGEPDALTQIKQNEWLLNEASIYFYVNQSELVEGGETEPERIIIYNLDEQTVLADYIFSADDFSALNSLTRHIGRLEREDNEDLSSNGIRYRVVITEHIRNILESDQENVKLGLAVSQNVRLATGSEVLNQTSPVEIGAIPLGSAYSHEGTILHGNLSTDPDKQLKLELYYTPIEE